MAKAKQSDGSTVGSKGAKRRGGAQRTANGNTRSLASILCTRAAVTLGALTALFLAIAVPRPSELLPPFERVPGDTPASLPISNDLYERTNIWFNSGDSNGTMISAWKYLPKNWRGIQDDRLPPVVIMAHGLGGQRDFGLHNTADVFARAGLAVLVFDYRTFGGSDGEPRNWASPSRHLRDWRAAAKYVMGPECASEWDTSRVVLWGTSYSGGHVLVLASELKDKIKGVISQVPHLSAPAAAGVSLAFRGLLPSLRMLVAGFYDTFRAKLGLSPVYIPLAGPHNSLTVMALTPEELKSYYAKHPAVKLGGWQNKVVGRFVLEAAQYSPMLSLRNITAPTLLIAAGNDTLCPPEVVAHASQILGVDVLMFPVDHFALYLTEVWAQSVAQQLSFVCNVTQQDCPQDKAFEISPMVTTIGARHTKATEGGAAGGVDQGVAEGQAGQQTGGGIGNEGETEAAGEDDGQDAQEEEAED